MIDAGLLYHMLQSPALMKDSQISLTSSIHPWALRSGMRFAVKLFRNVLHDLLTSKHLADLADILMIQ